MWGWIGSLAQGLVSGLATPISNIFIASKNNEGAEFAAMTAAERDEFIALKKSETELNNAKVTNNQSRVSHMMIVGFGLPPMIYLGMFYISAAFPGLGFHVDPLRGDMGRDLFDMGKTIALSFFLYGGAVTLGGPVFASLASRLRGNP